MHITFLQGANKMNYVSTRNNKTSVSSAFAIAHGISAEGGLYVPENIPVLNNDDFIKLSELDYKGKAEYVLKKYLTDFTDEELSDCINSAYTKEKFETDSIAPVYKMNNNQYILFQPAGEINRAVKF